MQHGMRPLSLPPTPHEAMCIAVFVHLALECVTATVVQANIIPVMEHFCILQPNTST